MPETNNQHYVDQYSENVIHLAQRKKSKLWPLVMQETNVVGKKFSKNQIGTWSMAKKTGRNAATPSSDPNLSRRWSTITTYHDAVLLDRNDSFQILADPMGNYTKAASSAMGRQIDDEIIAHILGLSTFGEEGDSTVALPSTQKIANGGTNLTFDKVRAVKEIFNENEVGTDDDDDDRVHFVCSPKGMSSLLKDPEVTSSDFATIQAIQNGQFHGKQWMGFNWVMTSALQFASGSSTVRENFAFSPYGVCAGMHTSPLIRVQERADLSYSNQIYYELGIGASRIEEKRVVQCDIDETA